MGEPGGTLVPTLVPQYSRGHLKGPQESEQRSGVRSLRMRGPSLFWVGLHREAGSYSSSKTSHPVSTANPSQCMDFRSLLFKSII